MLFGVCWLWCFVAPLFGAKLVMIWCGLYWWFRLLLFTVLRLLDWMFYVCWVGVDALLYCCLIACVVLDVCDLISSCCVWLLLFD